MAVVAQTTQLQKAQASLYLVECKGPSTEAYVIGSAFPVGDDLVMAAKHLNCPDGQTTILQEGGKQITILDENNYEHQGLDIRILVDFRKHDQQTFRAAVVGEHATAFGAAFGSPGFATDGHVMWVDRLFTVTDAKTIGGMSGSAIFGDDGSIIGMTVMSKPDSRHMTSVNVAISGDLLGDALALFKDNVQYK